MSFVTSRSHMRSRMILFCFVVAFVTVVSSWMIVNKQAEVHRIGQFSQAIAKTIDATNALLSTQNQLLALTATNLSLKDQKPEVDKNSMRNAVIGGGKQMQSLYGDLDKKNSALSWALEKQRVSIAEKRDIFDDNLNVLRGLYYGLQTSVDVKLTEVEKRALAKILTEFNSTGQKNDISKLVNVISTQNMPDTVKTLWTDSKDKNTLSASIANILKLAYRLSYFKNYEDKAARDLIIQFEGLANGKVQSQLNLVASRLSNEADITFADQKTYVLLTGFAMLISMLGAILFIINPLMRKVSIAQAELTQSNIELKEAIIISQNAERAKSEFLANMSHEIRTPMNGVLGMAEILGKTDMDLRQRKFVNVIIKSGNALLTIINDILDFSKIDAGQLTLDTAPFHLLEAVEDVATLMSAKVSEKDMELIVRVDPMLPEMFIGDVGRFRQILTNLMGNAVKFTEHGHVLVNVIGDIKKNVANLKISVTDTGIGIAQDKLHSVFMQFNQVDTSSTRRHEGTGLGLAIASKLTNLMNGNISVHSIVGEGSTFTATIEVDVYEGTKLADKGLPTFLNGSRILVVDDNSVNRDILQEQLSFWGFDSAATEDAIVCKTFLEKAVSYGISIDCLVLDYHMPLINGATLAYDLHNDPRFRSIPKILLSSVDQIDHGKLINDGVICAWLTKPATSKQLRETIIEAIHDAKVKSGQQVADLKNIAKLMKHPEHVPTAPVIYANIPENLLHTSIMPIVVRQDQNAPKIINDYILVAEDNEINQFVASQILDGMGQKHEIYANGKLLIDAWLNLKPKLILMDISMPEMNGLVATQTIRELEKTLNIHTPIIGLTAHALKGDKERCIEAGMDDYLTKPVSSDKLEMMIQKYIDNSKIKAA
jgi:signal transduction histidine kinase/DNA-binding response OmpR family regulator